MSSNSIPPDSWKHPANLTVIVMFVLIVLYAGTMIASDVRTGSLCHSVGHTHMSGGLIPFPTTFECYTPVRYTITTEVPHVVP